MARKTAQNRYGVQIGDIFNWKSHHEDGGGYDFYQVVALRGETQIVVREIKSQVIAFDGVHEGVVPAPDSWISDEILVRKVQSGESAPDAGLKAFEDGICSVSIKISDNWLGYAHLDRKEMYVSSERSLFAELLQKYHPNIAKQFDLERGTGVFAVDRAFVSYGDDCRAVIRYPDGKEQEVILKDLLHYEEERQEWERKNSSEAGQNRERLLKQWLESQKGASADE